MSDSSQYNYFPSLRCERISLQVTFSKSIKHSCAISLSVAVSAVAITGQNSAVFFYNFFEICRLRSCQVIRNGTPSRLVNSDV